MTIRAYALNAKTLTITHEIPFTTMSLTNTLNGVGDWQMELPVSFTSPDGVELFTSDNFDPVKTIVVFVRDEMPLLAGLFLEEDGMIDENMETIKIGGPEAALGYLKHRMYQSGMAIYNNVDQFTIASDIVIAGTNVGLGGSSGPIMTFTPAALSGVLRSRTYKFADRKMIYELLSELAAVENGFDFTSNVGGSQATGFTLGIKFGYPQLYRKTGLTLQLGKNVKRVSYSRQGSRFANVVYVGGANKGDSSTVASAVDTLSLSSYPYFMRSESRPTVIDQTTLQSHANRYLSIYGKVPTAFTVELDANDPDCSIGSFVCGDEFRFICKKGRLSIDSLYRVESWSLDVNEDGQETFKMTLFETGSL